MSIARFAASLLPLLATAAVAAPALAGPPPPPPPPPAPSLAGKVQLAKRLYDAEDYVAAAAAYHDVATGPAGGDQPVARLGLVRALVHLDLHVVAKAWALPMAKADAASDVRAAALPWLVELARVLDPDPELLAALATYSEVEMADARFDGVRGDLYAMIGRARYERGELQSAVVALDSVPPDAEDYVPAQFLSGVAQTRLGDGQAASVAFKNVLRTNAAAAATRDRRTTARLDRFAHRRSRLRGLGRDRALKRLGRRLTRRGMTSVQLDRYVEHQRIDEMTNLSMAYVFYQAGQLELASKYFGRVPQTSPYWLDAIFGDAWAEFLEAYIDEDNANAHYQQVLGHVHTLRAPFFPYRLYPEVPLLAAMTYYYNCRYGSASRALDDFDERYLLTRTRLRAFLDDQREDFELADLFTRLRTGQDTGLDDATLHIVDGLLDDRALQQQHDRIARIDAQRDVAGALSLASPALAENIQEEIEFAASAAREDSGAAVRARLETAVREITRYERQALGIRYELAPKLVKQPGAEGSATRPKPDVQHDLYEYNGEYWQDELGHYRVKITSLCK